MKKLRVSKEVLQALFDIYEEHDCANDTACKVEDRLGDFMSRLTTEKKHKRIKQAVKRGVREFLETFKALAKK